MTGWPGDGPRVLVLNRWDDDFAEYHRYVDHRVARVGYVTVPSGRARLDPAQAVAIETVDAVAPGPALDAAARRVATALGGVDRVVCLSELDLLTAAELRRSLGAEGPGPEIVARFKDKTVMKAAVRAAGLPVPDWAPAADAAAVDRLVAEAGLPIVLKPLVGAASQGVRRIDTPADLAAARADLPLDDYEAETFVAGPILHIDGVVRDGRPLLAVPSRYVDTCLGFAQGRTLGSVMMDPGPESRRLQAFTADCLDALGHADGAFHLEVIDHPRRGLVFLEIGARVGGGEIPFVFRDVLGVDLFAEWLKIDFGQPSGRMDGPGPGRTAGFMMVPEPADPPWRVAARHSLLGRIDGLYAEDLPAVGDILDGRGGYDRIGGRFRFRGDDAASVMRAVQAARERYRLIVERPDGRLPAEQAAQ